MVGLYHDDMPQCGANPNPVRKHCTFADAHHSSLSSQLWTRMATVIQKSFRAFYSRRYKHSYYERKAYLASVTLKDEKIRELSEAVAESQYQEREQLRRTQAEEEFLGLAKDLHHLCSTGSIPGVFNSPYNMEPVRAFGKPVESQLKATFARSGYLKKHLTRAMGKARYTAIHGHSMGQTADSLGSGAYTHSSMPRPLEPLAEEAATGQRSRTGRAA